MAEAKYIIGIDLGTSNCAVASVDVDKGAAAPVVDFAVFQIVRPTEKRERPLLPSAIYLAGEHELSPELLRLPWGESPRQIAGEFAQWQGARTPGRLVTSAKSWLCHQRVDRMARILPWGALEDVEKISPVEASALLLKHMVAAWNHAHPDYPAASQDVVITVPASFDEVARALTVNAARQAGLEKFTLLEEPQAAFYDFTARHRTNLETALRETSLVLVVDVGGGTSDFTLVEAGVTAEGPLMRRIAVGEHLMLGGDNMDVALARKVETELRAKLTSAQWNQLVQAARAAKESLLSAKAPAVFNIAIAGEGSRLVGSSISAQLKRGEVEAAVLEGFFPRVAASVEPKRSARGGIQELGLPYAQDPSVTTHIAAFLRMHAKAGFAALHQTAKAAGELPRPDAILLNGGVFNSAKISARLLEVLSSWWPSEPRIPTLEHDSLELAVARGAAYYGLVRRGFGRRIGGGAAHAFYVGLSRAGETKANSAVCIIPRGQEEGQTVELLERSFDLTVGVPVQFPLYSTTEDRVDKAGEIVPLSGELKPLPPTHTLLRARNDPRKKVPVHLRATLTEIGTLELWCVSNTGGEEWRLEFELRGSGEDEQLTVTESMPARFREARAAVEHIYGNRLRGQSAEGLRPSFQLPKDVKNLWPSLENSLGAREHWGVPVLRELWGSLFASKNRRRRTANHERVFFQLAGYCLRPGFGYPLDAWRSEQTFGLFNERVEFHKEKPVWNEFWILWRRIAGGLSEAHQMAIRDYLKPALAVKLGRVRGNISHKGVQPEGLDEMVRTAAALEHLPASDKMELGSWILDRLQAHPAAGGPWTWALGRLGARVPFYGSPHRVVPAQEVERWIEALLKMQPEKVEGAAFALVQLARLSGDRTRDISDPVRMKVLAEMERSKAIDSWKRLLKEVVAFEASDEARSLGDTLPAGLQLSN